MVDTRREGKSKLVYNKQTRTIDTVRSDTPPPLSGEGSVGDMVSVPRDTAQKLLQAFFDYSVVIRHEVDGETADECRVCGTLPAHDLGIGCPISELQCILSDSAPPLPAQEVTDGWQGMESAPRNGSAILIYQPWKSGRETICIGHYANGWVNQMCLYCAHDQHKEFGYELGNEVTEIGNEHCQPTHWRPLPAPPESALRTGEE
jgi:Protein of unknown function (DUF551)